MNFVTHVAGLRLFTGKRGTRWSVPLFQVFMRIVSHSLVLEHVEGAHSFQVQRIQRTERNVNDSLAHALCELLPPARRWFFRHKDDARLLGIDDSGNEEPFVPRGDKIEFRIENCGIQISKGNLKSQNSDLINPETVSLEKRFAMTSLVIARNDAGDVTTKQSPRF